MPIKSKYFRTIQLVIRKFLAISISRHVLGGRVDACLSTRCISLVNPVSALLPVVHAEQNRTDNDEQVQRLCGTLLMSRVLLDFGKTEVSAADASTRA